MQRTLSFFNLPLTEHWRKTIILGMTLFRQRDCSLLRKRIGSRDRRKEILLVYAIMNAQVAVRSFEKNTLYYATCVWGSLYKYMNLLSREAFCVWSSVLFLLWFFCVGWEYCIRIGENTGLGCLPEPLSRSQQIIFWKSPHICDKGKQEGPEKYCWPCSKILFINILEVWKF